MELAVDEKKVFLGFYWPVFRSRLKDLDYKRVDIEAEEDLEELSNATRGGTLFGADFDLVVAVVQDADLSPEIAEHLKRSQESIWVLAPLDSKKDFDDFEVEKAVLPDSKSEIKDWIQSQVKQLGGEIDGSAISWLSGELNSVFEIKRKSKKDKWVTLALLRQDLKSMIDRAEDRMITREIAEELLTVNFEESIFEILRKMSDKNLKEALEVYETLLQQGVSIYQLMPLLAGQLLDWLMVGELKRSGHSQDEIQEVTGWKSGRVWAVLNEAGEYSKPELKRAIAKLLEIDFNNKTSRGEPEISLAGWVADLANR